jgi:chemotaxis response regulator CheB
VINVLVVEDSRVIRDHLVYTIETDPKIRVMGAAEIGEAALEMLGELRPDVILMDIHLPGIDGFETTRRIMSSTPVPIVVCTASANFDEVRTAMRALEAGALTVLKKPGGFGDPGNRAEAAMINTLKLMSEVKVVRRWNGTAAAGRVGDEELRLMADQDALTVAQDEESCLVFSMPGEAAQLGDARFVLPPRRIADLLNTSVLGGVNRVAMNV